MSEHAAKLLEQVLALPPADRDMIAAHLRAGAEAEGPHPDVPGEVVTGDEWNAAWHDEIAARLEAYDRGEVQALTLDEVEARLRKAVEGARG